MERADRSIIFFAPGISGEESAPDILRTQGYNVVYVKSLPELLMALGKNDFDLAVFGISPGSGNITDLSATIRSICKVPVLFILPPDIDSYFLDQVKTCADDFLIWPIRDEELILRTDLVISCHSRRDAGRDRDRFQIGAMIFDYKNQMLHTSSGAKSLTRIEAQLLHLLCLYRNTILPRELALETIWGENDYFKARSMDVYVAKLRKLVKEDSSVSISNIHKVGFRLDIKSGNNGKQG